MIEISINHIPYFTVCCELMLEAAIERTIYYEDVHGIEKCIWKWNEELERYDIQIRVSEMHKITDDNDSDI